MKREINLIHLPIDTFVFIEDNFRKKFLNVALDVFGSASQLMKTLNMSPAVFVYWYNGKQYDYEAHKMGPAYMDLEKVKLISNLLCKQGLSKFSMDRLQEHFVSYRLPAGKPICDLRFPVKESPELVRLLFHLLGDGYGGKTGENANYKNTCNELIDEFRNDLRIFGNAPLYEQQYSIKFSRLIADLIRNFYDVKLETFDSRISTRIKEIPTNLVVHGIRAFADDEACAYRTYIRFSSANLDLLDGIRELITERLKIKCNPVRAQYGKKATYGVTYYFDLKDIHKYAKLVGFTHPKKSSILSRSKKR